MLRLPDLGQFFPGRAHGQRRFHERTRQPARSEGMVLVTNNVSEFSRVQAIEVENSVGGWPVSEIAADGR